MVVHEFRIPMPLTVDEFHRGQMFMVAQKSLEVTDGDEGIEWIKNEPYDNTDGRLGVSPITGVEVPRNKGQYTLKRYHLKSKMPRVAVSLAPSSSLYLIEEAWNAYPHCKTVLVNGYLSKDKFRIDVETVHVDNDCELDNVVGLTPEELKHRKVEVVDIRAAYHDTKAEDYNEHFDVTKYHSEKTGRGPLEADWQKSGKTPVMCAYKVVRADFKYFGMQTKIEHTIIHSQSKLFAQTCAQAAATIDEWVEKSMPEIRLLEAEASARSAATVERLRAKGEAPDIPDGEYYNARGGLLPAGSTAAAGSTSTAAGAGAASS